jgi:WSC domain
MSVSRLVVGFLLLLATQVQAQYIGCFKDQADRDLSGFATAIEGNTNAVCGQTCAAKGFQYSGTQFGAQCFCGNTYGKYGPATNCESPCGGNSAEKCGGDWANSVSRTGGGTKVSLSPPNAPILLSPGDISRSGWQPAIRGFATQGGTSIPLAWQVTGTPNNLYQVTHWLDLWRWNSATRAWDPVFANYVGGPLPINYAFNHPVEVARGTCYYWRVFGVNPQRNTNPWYTPSNWSGFCTAN